MQKSVLWTFLPSLVEVCSDFREEDIIIEVYGHKVMTIAHMNRYVWWVVKAKKNLRRKCINVDHYWATPAFFKNIFEGGVLMCKVSIEASWKTKDQYWVLSQLLINLMYFISIFNSATWKAYSRMVSSIYSSHYL